jgi:hypothetical protein
MPVKYIDIDISGKIYRYIADTNDKKKIINTTVTRLLTLRLTIIRLLLDPRVA